MGGGRHFPRKGKDDYFFSPQTYELISAPSGISVTFGVFQAMAVLLAPGSPTGRVPLALIII
ncbi:hypothetical protein AD937_07120 [Gluconobacter japonicus]|nr:hypothetical protein AD937_07120 [Gluconobacter japonicus]